MQLTLVRGTGSAAGHPLLRARPDALVLDGLRPFPTPWAGACALLALLRARSGAAAVTHALRPHEAQLALCLPSLCSTEPDEDAAAQELGYLSHHPTMRLPLVVAWRGALTPLLGGVRALLVPDTRWLDAESVHVFLGLPLEHLVMAKDPDVPERPLWQRDDHASAFLLYLLAGRADATVIDREEPSPSTDPIPAAPEAADPDPSRRLVAMQRAFRAFGFATVLALTRGIDPAPLPRPDRARWHTLLGVSAYNRHVRGGDAALAELLEHHFYAALACEDDPARRSHLHYRLCINHGRRKAELDRAEANAHAAVREGRAANGAASNLVTAWALNALAYIHARQGRLAEARGHCHEAAVLLDRAPPSREAQYGGVVLADNRAELAFRAGDDADARACQADLARREYAWGGHTTLSARRSIELELRAHALDRAVVLAREGLEWARVNLDPALVDSFAMTLGELCYRRGDATGAVAAYTVARAVRVRIGDPADVGLCDAAIGLAAARAGHLDLAEAALLRTPTPTPAARAEVAAQRAWIAAQAGDTTRADALAEDAITAAVEGGARDELCRVARLCAETCLTLGRASDAAETFAQALALGGPASERTAALVGLTVATGDHAHAMLALPELAHALDDAEGWWTLARVSRLVPLPQELAKHLLQRVEGGADLPSFGGGREPLPAPTR